MIDYDKLTSEEVEQHFKGWFVKQVNNGLTNFGISVNETATDPTEVKREILKMEQNIRNGNFEILP
jgi:hypothetical protein